MPDMLAAFSQPKPTTVTIATSIGAVVVTYDRHAFHGEIIDHVYSTPIVQRLSRVLLAWDMTLNGEPMQPPSLEDTAHWDAAAQAARSEDADTP
jgi:hypothetical protein